MKRRLIIGLIIFVVFLVVYGKVNANAASNYFYPKYVKELNTEKYLIAFVDSTGAAHSIYLSDYPFRVENDRLVATGNYDVMLWNRYTSPPADTGSWDKLMNNKPTSDVFGNGSYSNYCSTLKCAETNIVGLQGFEKNIPLNAPISEAYVGEILLKARGGEYWHDGYVNNILGYDTIKCNWTKQSETPQYSLIAIKTGWFGTKSYSLITSGIAYNNNIELKIEKPSMDLTYALMITDKKGTLCNDMGINSKNATEYLFAFTQTSKPRIDILGVKDGATYSTEPNVTVKKSDSNIPYEVSINNKVVYTMSSNLSDTFTFSKKAINLGANLIEVRYNGTLYKSVNFEVKPDGSGTSTGGGTGGIPDDETNPPDTYEPPSVEEGKPTKPAVTDDYSKWIYYYLENILYYIQLPFKMLTKILKDLSKTVLDSSTSFMGTYNKLIAATKTLFSFVPASVWSVVSFGFCLSIILWFVKWRK